MALESELKKYVDRQTIRPFTCFRTFTCVLEAKEEVNGNDQGPFRHDCPPPRRHRSWKVHRNPYCPTERFYDTVEFAFSSSSNGTSSSSSRASTTGAAVGNTGHDDDDDARRLGDGWSMPPDGSLFTKTTPPLSRTNAVRAPGRLSHGVLLQCRHEQVGPTLQRARRNGGGVDSIRWYRWW
jgi:hypothetical protein